MWRALRAIAALTYHLAVLPSLRIPMLLPFAFATPFLLLFILFIIGGADYLLAGLVGALVMSVTQQGLFLGADATYFKREHRFQDIVVASPLSAPVYFVGLAVHELVFAAPALAVLLGVVVVHTGRLHVVPGMLFVLLLTWITTSAIGFFLSTYVLSVRSAFVSVSFLGSVLAVLPPVFYPLESLSPPLQTLAGLAPTTHAAVLLRGIVGGAPLLAPSESWIALAAHGAFFLALALLRSRWREP